jgi:hypothetical protein
MSTNPFNDPNHAKLLKIWNEMNVPGFVKTAESVTEQDFNVVDVKHFGDPAKRLYPLNSKSNAWLSREHFNRDKEGIPKEAAEVIDARIQKAAQFWGLDQPIRKQDPEAPTTIFHVTIDGDHNKEKQILDLTGHYKTACETFYENRNAYPYPVRRSFARQVLSAPADVREPLDVDIEEGLCKMANFGSCTGSAARDAVFMRMCYVKKKDPEAFGQLVKVAKHLQDIEGLVNIDLLHKTATLLDAVDRSNGLHVRYGRDLNTPEETLFGFTEKRASVVRDEALILADGSIVNRFELLSEKDKVNEYFTKIAGAQAIEDDDTLVDAVMKLHESELDTFYDFVGS